MNTNKRNENWTMIKTSFVADVLNQDKLWQNVYLKERVVSYKRDNMNGDLDMALN